MKTSITRKGLFDWEWRVDYAPGSFLIGWTWTKWGAQQAVNSWNSKHMAHVLLKRATEND